VRQPDARDLAVGGKAGLKLVGSNVPWQVRDVHAKAFGDGHARHRSIMPQKWRGHVTFRRLSHDDAPQHSLRPRCRNVRKGRDKREAEAFGGF
jgi:hypothetical protein